MLQPFVDFQSKLLSGNILLSIEEFLIRDAVQLVFIIAGHEVAHLVADGFVEATSARVGGGRVHVDAACALGAGELFRTGYQR